MKTDTYKILQLTDMHLFADTESRLLGVNTQDSFAAVLELAKALHPTPDMICLTGDISQDETIVAYERIAQMLQVYQCPKYWIPGNHDDIGFMSQVFPIFHIQQAKHVILDQWQVIMLNSKLNDKVEGHLDEDQFAFLEEALARHPDHHALIFLHHHPLPVGSKWIDNLMLDNAEKFWDAIDNYNNIKLIICGHVHQEKKIIHRGIHMYATPSTCFQFESDSFDFSVENKMPGYRVIELFPDGTHETAVHRLENFELNLNVTTHGY